MAKGGKQSVKNGGTPQKPGAAGAPSSPELRDAWRRQDEGDAVAARRIATALLAGGTLTPEDRASAEDLIGRTRFPVWAFAFAAGAGAIIVLLIVVALLRS